MSFLWGDLALNTGNGPELFSSSRISANNDLSKTCGLPRKIIENAAPLHIEVQENPGSPTM